MTQVHNKTEGQVINYILLTISSVEFLNPIVQCILL